MKALEEPQKDGCRAGVRVGSGRSCQLMMSLQLSGCAGVQVTFSDTYGFGLAQYPNSSEPFSPWWSCREVHNTEEVRSQCLNSGQAGGRAKCLPDSPSMACATLSFPTTPCLPRTLHTYVCVATSDGFFPTLFPSGSPSMRAGEEAETILPQGFPSFWHSRQTVDSQKIIIIAMTGY